MREIDPRPLTRDEYALLWHLLSSVEFPQVEHFRAQLPFTWVRAECDCGCGTIDLTLDLTRADPAPSPLWHERAFLLLETSEPNLWLIQGGGELLSLEGLPPGDAHEDPPRPFHFPDLTRLEVELQIDPEDLPAIE